MKIQMAKEEVASIAFIEKTATPCPNCKVAIEVRYKL